MRIASLDERKNSIVIDLETPEDLYFASLLIEPGDELTAWTTRQIKIDQGGRVERGERVRVKLTLKVKKVDFQRFTDSLRVLGLVIEAPEWLSAKGSHHTIGLHAGDRFTLRKNEFTRYHRKILELATTRVRVLGVVCADFEEVVAAVLRPQGLEVLARTFTSKPPKEGSLKSFLERKSLPRIASCVKLLRSRGAIAVIAAAQPLLAEFLNEVKEELGIKEVVKVSEGGLAGLYELLRSKNFERFMEEVKLLPSKNALEEMVETLIRSPGKVALGLKEVSDAFEAGAVKTLLLLDEVLLGDEREKVMQLLSKASRSAKDIVVIPPHLEKAEILKKFGGVAALLYFRIR